MPARGTRDMSLVRASHQTRLNAVEAVIGCFTNFTESRLASTGRLHGALRDWKSNRKRASAFTRAFDLNPQAKSVATTAS